MEESVVRKSESIGALVAALAKAQAEFTNPERNRKVTVRTKTGGSYEFAYATLDAILDQVRPILAKNEIVVLGGIQPLERHIRISTMLAHSSGEWVESSVQFPGAVGAQETGSLITYGKRYTLCGLLGIAAEEDDDSNSASGNQIEDRPSVKPEPRVERDPVPAYIPMWEGCIVNMKSKGGKNKDTGKPWTKYTLVGADGDEFSTFSESIVEMVKSGGKSAIFQILYTDGKYGRDVEEIRKVDELPF